MQEASVVLVHEGVGVSAVAQQLDEALEGNRIELANYHLKNIILMCLTKIDPILTKMPSLRSSLRHLSEQGFKNFPLSFTKSVRRSVWQVEDL